MFYKLLWFLNAVPGVLRPKTSVCSSVWCHKPLSESWAEPVYLNINLLSKVGSFIHGINFLRLLEFELKVAQKFFFGDICDHGSKGWDCIWTKLQLGGKSWVCACCFNLGSAYWRLVVASKLGPLVWAVAKIQVWEKLNWAKGRKRFDLDLTLWSTESSLICPEFLLSQLCVSRASWTMTHWYWWWLHDDPFVRHFDHRMVWHHFGKCILLLFTQLGSTAAFRLQMFTEIQHFELQDSSCYNAGEAGWVSRYQFKSSSTLETTQKPVAPTSHKKKLG